MQSGFVCTVSLQRDKLIFSVGDELFKSDNDYCILYKMK